MSRSDQFLAPVDHDLVELKPAERDAFPSRLIDHWEQRYANWQYWLWQGSPLAARPEFSRVSKQPSPGGGLLCSWIDRSLRTDERLSPSGENSWHP